jgi:hypothetical protein
MESMSGREGSDRIEGHGILAVRTTGTLSMGFSVVPGGSVPTATILASGRITTPSNLSVAREKARDSRPSPRNVQSSVPSSSTNSTTFREQFGALADRG